MHRKLVYRYYCDFCRKATCSAMHTSKHERGCTANPNRLCGVCLNAEIKQDSLADLIAAVNENGLTGVRAASNGCPVCIFAAIRQARAAEGDEGEWIEFNLQEELAQFWKSVNEERALSDCHG